MSVRECPYLEVLVHRSVEIPNEFIGKRRKSEWTNRGHIQGVSDRCDPRFFLSPWSFVQVILTIVFRPSGKVKQVERNLIDETEYSVLDKVESYLLLTSGHGF